MTAAREVYIFTSTCDEIIAAHPGNREVEDAVIQLEVAYKKDLNAKTREYNAEIDEYRNSVNEQSRGMRNSDKQYFQMEVQRLTKDFQDQFIDARERYQEDLTRVKETYQELFKEQERRGHMITRLHDDHRKELDRVNKEWNRIVSNKNKEIQRLNDYLNEGIGMTSSVFDQQEMLRRRSEEEVSVLRQRVLQLQVEGRRLECDYRTRLIDSRTQLDRVIQASTRLVNEFQNKVVDLELGVSQMHAFSNDNCSDGFRGTLKEDNYQPTVQELSEQMEAIDDRRKREQMELEMVVANAKEVRAQQAKAVCDYQQMINDEVQKLVTLPTPCSEAENDPFNYSIFPESSNEVTPRAKAKEGSSPRAQPRSPVQNSD